MSPLQKTSAAPLGPLRTLRLASLGEGATLLLLVLIAVPLKRLAGMPEAVSVMGPIHGAAFLLYLAVVFKNLSARRINQQDWPSAARELRRWVYGGGIVLPGLVARRTVEAELMCS